MDALRAGITVRMLTGDHVSVPPFAFNLPDGVFSSPRRLLVSLVRSESWTKSMVLPL